MQEFQLRVIEELEALNLKLDKLTSFKNSSVFETLHPVDRNLLQEQWMAMIDYRDILELRIERFGKEAINATPH